MKTVLRDPKGSKLIDKTMKYISRVSWINYKNVNKKKVRLINLLKAENITYFDYNKRFKNWYKKPRVYNTFEEAFGNA